MAIPHPISDRPRWHAEIQTGPPEVHPSLQGGESRHLAVGGMQIDRSQRGLLIEEHDTRQLVRLSAAEALELLAYLQQHTELLQQMAQEDADTLSSARWREAGDVTPPA